MTILDQLAEHAAARVAIAKESVPIDEIRRMAMQTGPAPSFAKAISKPGISFICECKKASPSKGLIAPQFNYLEIAKEYEKAGADAISVLTEPKWFLGDDRYLSEIASTVSVPCLRKDFTVDEYMIYEAKTLGASCILLICAILDDDMLRDFGQLASDLGLSAIYETHDEREVERALNAGAKILGVNNRNLKDFSVDCGNTKKLRNVVPSDVSFIAESGVKNSDDVADLAQVGVDAILIGEALMRADDKTAKLAELKSWESKNR